MLTDKNKLKKLFLFAFFAMIGTSFNYINAQEIVIEQLSANKFQFDIENLAELSCSCPDRFNEARYSYFWRFGDGGYSKRKNPIYEYYEEGDFSVQLEVTPIYTDQPPEREAYTEPLHVEDVLNDDEYEWTTGFKNDFDFPYMFGIFQLDKSVDAIVPGQRITYIITVNQFIGPSVLALTNFTYGFTFEEEESFQYSQADYITSGISSILHGDQSIGWSLSGGNASHYRRIFVTFEAPEMGYILPGESFSFGLASTNNSQYLTNVNYIGGNADQVRLSFDPNMKKVNYDYISHPEKLEYEVHFQNYGDGPTNFIQIEDEIHPLLDFDALEILEIQIGNKVYDLTDPNSDPNLDPHLDPGTDFHYLTELNADERKIEMTLYNAYLEGTGNPAYNECANEYTTGYVKFAIPTIDFDETTLENGTLISNEASITFDYNFPIETETVYTEIDYGNDNCPTGYAGYKTLHDGENFSKVVSKDINTVFTINAGSRVTLDAGTYVTIKPGSFWKPGSKVTAKIGGCTTNYGENSGYKFEGISHTESIGMEGLTSYPNPFTDQTKIEFDLEKASRVNLDVYSLEGKHIVNIIDNQFRHKGKYALRFDEQLDPGVYLLMLKTETERRTFKLLKSN